MHFDIFLLFQGFKMTGEVTIGNLDQFFQIIEIHLIVH